MEKLSLNKLEQYLSKAAWILKGPVDAADFKIYISSLFCSLNESLMPTDRQVKVLVVAESRPPKKKHINKSRPEKAVRFIKMKVLESVTKDAVNYEVQSNVEPSAEAVTDGKRCYADLKHIPAKHEIVNSADRDEVSKNLPWVHIVISNAKKMCLGVHHSINRHYMQNYMSEFCYKFNRRYLGQKLFSYLLHKVY